jgi:hypothetical protein
MKFQCRVIVQRSFPPLRFSLPLWKTFRSKANAIPVDSQKVFVFPQE